MRTLLFILTLMIAMGTGSAYAAAPIIPGAGMFGLGVVAMQDAANGIPACYHEPIRRVKWIESPGYSFEVAGCDYQAKKDRLIVIKVLQ